jgi:hypothetical protein
MNNAVGFSIQCSRFFNKMKCYCLVDFELMLGFVGSRNLGLENENAWINKMKCYGLGFVDFELLLGVSR